MGLSAHEIMENHLNKQPVVLSEKVNLLGKKKRNCFSIIYKMSSHEKFRIFLSKVENINFKISWIQILEFPNNFSRENFVSKIPIFIFPKG